MLGLISIEAVQCPPWDPAGLLLFRRLPLTILSSPDQVWQRWHTQSTEEIHPPLLLPCCFPLCVQRGSSFFTSSLAEQRHPGS